MGLAPFAAASGLGSSLRPMQTAFNNYLYYSGGGGGSPYYK